MRKARNYICKGCGNPFSSPQQKPTYCTYKCFTDQRPSRETLHCENCGKLCKTNYKDYQKYCSMACRSEAVTGKYRTLFDITCQTCGVIFHPRYKERKYCSAACSRDPQMRFWRNVDKTAECWVWLASQNAQGYGIFKAEGFKGRSAHRYSYFLANGPIPDDLQVLHRCDNPPCVNPSHLFLGTQKDNVDDMMKKGRQVSIPGSKNVNAKLNESDVLAIRHKYFNLGVPTMKLAAEFGVVHSTIYSVVKRIRWRHVQ